MELVTVIEIIGWIGGIGFAICAAPLAVSIYRTHETAGLTWWFLILWSIGEVFTLVYVVLVSYYISHVWQYPLIANYVFNFFLLSYCIIMKYLIEAGKLSGEV
jgi:uncharacterized protein with PQ loop repeat